MRKMNGLILALILMVGVPFLAAFAQTDAETNGVNRWGDKVNISSLLGRGLTFGWLFGPATPARDVAAAWLKNAQTADDAEWTVFADANLESAVKDILARLNDAFVQNPGIDWTYRDLYVNAWADLPGDPAAKDALKGLFTALKVDGKKFDLTFVKEDGSTAAPVAEVGALLDRLISHRLFSCMETADLYYMPATPGLFSDDDITLLQQAFEKGLKVLRAEPGDIVTVKDGVITPYTDVYACCVRTTRVCQSALAGSCTMNGNYCASGCTFCS